MNNESQPTVGADAFLPLVLLALSFGIILVWQLSNVSQQRTAIQQNREQLEAAFNQSTPQHEQLIAQSRAVQGKLETLVTDLLSLAHSGDKDAQEIVDKYKIQQQGAPAPSATPAATK